jgi:DoxX-like family
MEKTEMQITAPVSNQMLWAGRILGALPVLFLLFDGIAKLFRPAPVVEATVQLGYPASVILPLGIVLTLCAIIYAIPRTAVLGAILLTGYLGGAVNTHVRVSGGWFPILFPVILGVLLWGGLYLTEQRLHALLPLTTTPPVTSPKMLWAGRMLSALPALLLLFSAAMKLMKPAPIVQGFTQMGYQENVILPLGILELACTILYLIPRTAGLGAILLTGYLGGATATHLRIGDPFFMPIILGVVLWGGLYLRNERWRGLIPVRQ